MLFTSWELIDAVLMTLIIGIIFADFFKRFVKPRHHDPLHHYQRKSFFGWFDKESFKIAILLIAPAIIFHELAHKFVAMGFGMEATFHAAYGWLAIGLLLKLMNFGFIFFVPAYIQISGASSALNYSIVAAAGPLMNALLWGLSALVVRKRLVRNKYIPIVALSGKINMFLFIFNMIPIPGFDGYKVLMGLIQIF